MLVNEEEGGHWMILCGWVCALSYIQCFDSVGWVTGRASCL